MLCIVDYWKKHIKLANNVKNFFLTNLNTILNYVFSWKIMYLKDVNNSKSIIIKKIVKHVCLIQLFMLLPVNLLEMLPRHKGYGFFFRVVCLELIYKINQIFTFCGYLVSSNPCGWLSTRTNVYIFLSTLEDELLTLHQR